MKRWVQRTVVPIMVFALGLIAATGQAADLSADNLAIAHDLLAPYRTGHVPATSAADAAAVKQALDILRSEKLVDFARPIIRPLGISDKLGRALATGTRTPQFLREIGAVHDAVVHQNEDAVRRAIQELYVKMGRAAPKDAALDGLVAAAQSVIGKEPQETDRVILKRLDYTITVENARAAGKAKVSVLMRQGPDGRPARVEFKGEVVTNPGKSGKDLETVVRPALAPETLTSAQADDLRKRLNGRWRDQDGVEYEISGEGASVVVTEFRVGGNPRPYVGTFDLGLISTVFPIDSADDINPSVPTKIREQLAGLGLTFEISLSATDAGSKLDGTWSSQHVTYDEGGTTIQKVHSPYDVPLLLTRPGPQTAYGAADDAPL